MDDLYKKYIQTELQPDDSDNELEKTLKDLARAQQDENSPYNAQNLIGLSGGISNIGKTIPKINTKEVKSGLSKLWEKAGFSVEDQSRAFERQKIRDMYPGIDEQEVKLIQEHADQLRNKNIQDLWQKEGYSPKQQQRAFERQKIREANPGISENELKQLQQQPYKEMSSLRDQINTGGYDPKKMERMNEIMSNNNSEQPNYKNLYNLDEMKDSNKFDKIMQLVKNFNKNK